MQTLRLPVLAEHLTLSTAGKRHNYGHDDVDQPGHA